MSQELRNISQCDGMLQCVWVRNSPTTKIITDRLLRIFLINVQRYCCLKWLIVFTWKWHFDTGLAIRTNDENKFIEWPDWLDACEYCGTLQRQLYYDYSTMALPHLKQDKPCRRCVINLKYSCKQRMRSRIQTNTILYIISVNRCVISERRMSYTYCLALTLIIDSLIKRH